MNASRHVTFKPHTPWISYAAFVKKPLPDRIKYVRGNLRDEKGGKVSQAKLATAIKFASGHYGVRRWEKGGTQPQRDNREALSRISPYPPEAFTKLGAEGVSLESIDARLQALEAAVAKVPTQEDLKRGLDTLRAAIDAQANPGTRTESGESG